jgi:hypothetical protein
MLSAADSKFVHAFFRDVDHASAAVRLLIEAHFPSDDISVDVPDVPREDGNVLVGVSTTEDRLVQACNTLSQAGAEETRVVAAHRADACMQTHRYKRATSHAQATRGTAQPKAPRARAQRGAAQSSARSQEETESRPPRPAARRYVH